jgi:hypothetical protein
MTFFELTIPLDNKTRSDVIGVVRDYLATNHTGHNDLPGGSITEELQVFSPNGESMRAVKFMGRHSLNTRSVIIRPHLLSLAEQLRRAKFRVVDETHIYIEEFLTHKEWKREEERKTHM